MSTVSERNAVSCDSRSNLDTTTQVVHAGSPDLWLDQHTRTCGKRTSNELNSEIQPQTTMAVFVLISKKPEDIVKKRKSPKVAESFLIYQRAKGRKMMFKSLTDIFLTAIKPLIYLFYLIQYETWDRMTSVCRCGGQILFYSHMKNTHV